MSEIRDRKRNERKLRRAARLARRDQRKAHRREQFRHYRCFWTWPLRHCWDLMEDRKVCTVCGLVHHKQPTQAVDPAASTFDYRS